MPSLADLAAGRGRGHPGGVDPQVHRGRGGCRGAGRMGDRPHADEADQAGAAHGLPGGGGGLAGGELAFQRGSDQGRAQRQVRAGLVVHGVGARPRDVEGGGHRRGPGVVRARDADQRARRHRDAGRRPLACGGRARGRCPGRAAGNQHGGHHSRQPCPGQPPLGAGQRPACPATAPGVPGRLGTLPPHGRCLALNQCQTSRFLPEVDSTPVCTHMLPARFNSCCSPAN